MRHDAVCFTAEKTEAQEGSLCPPPWQERDNQETDPHPPTHTLTLSPTQEADGWMSTVSLRGQSSCTFLTFLHLGTRGEETWMNCSCFLVEKHSQPGGGGIFAAVCCLCPSPPTRLFAAAIIENPAVIDPEDLRRRCLVSNGPPALSATGWWLPPTHCATVPLPGSPNDSLSSCRVWLGQHWHCLWSHTNLALSVPR